MGPQGMVEKGSATTSEPRLSEVQRAWAESRTEIPGKSLESDDGDQ